MKNLFLASIARNTLNKFIETLDCPTKKLNVAFIPTAGNIMKDNWFVAEDRKALINAGFNVFDVNLENKTKSQLLKEMENINIVFVAGGNTFYLLQEVIKSGFDEILASFIKDGGKYIGSSAGSLLAGPSIELAKNIDDQSAATDLVSYNGLGLVDFVVLPHFDHEDFRDKIEQNLQKHKNYQHKIIKISDNQAIIVAGNKIEIVSSKK